MGENGTKIGSMGVVSDHSIVHTFADLTWVDHSVATVQQAPSSDGVAAKLGVSLIGREWT